MNVARILGDEPPAGESAAVCDNLDSRIIIAGRGLNAGGGGSFWYVMMLESSIGFGEARKLIASALKGRRNQENDDKSKWHSSMLLRLIARLSCINGAGIPCPAMCAAGGARGIARQCGIAEISSICHQRRLVQPQRRRETAARSLI